MFFFPPTQFFPSNLFLWHVLKRQNSSKSMQLWWHLFISEFVYPFVLFVYPVVWFVWFLLCVYLFSSCLFFYLCLSLSKLSVANFSVYVYTLFLSIYLSCIYSCLFLYKCLTVYINIYPVVWFSVSVYPLVPLSDVVVCFGCPVVFFFYRCLTG